MDTMADLVVKSNQLVQALQNLTLAETRLIQLAIIDARETEKGLHPNEPLELRADRYATSFNLSADTAYSTLIEAEENLFKRQFTLVNDDGTITKSRWIQDANYKRGEGRIFITLTRVVIEHVTKINGFERYFTSYRLQQTSSFSSVYAIRLFELLMQWKSTGKTPLFQLEKLRLQLGIAVNEYKRVEAFKRRVLDVAVQQINATSDIIVKYEQKKKGRMIDGFYFSFSQKKTQNITKKINSNLHTIFKKMSDKQRYYFSNKLAELPEMSSYSYGTESYTQFAIRIAEMLKEEEKFIEFYPYLEKVGYLPAEASIKETN